MDLYLKTSLSPNDIRNLTKSFHLNLTAFGLLSYLVGLFIVHSTVGLAIDQRKGILRTFRCIGISTNQIIIFMFCEIIIIALISSILGIFLGIFMASILLPDVASTLVVLPNNISSKALSRLTSFLSRILF